MRSQKRIKPRMCLQMTGGRRNECKGAYLTKLTLDGNVRPATNKPYRTL